MAATPPSPSARRRLSPLTAAAVDALLLTVGLALNFLVWLGYVRLGEITAAYTALFANVVVPIVALRIALFWLLGLYRSDPARASFRELGIIAVADTAATFLIALFNVMTPWIESLGPTYPLNAAGTHVLRIPWGIVLNDWMLALILVGGARFARRAAVESMMRMRPGASRRVLIVGTDEAGHRLARDLTAATRGAYRAVGFIETEKGAAHAAEIQGIPVMGAVDELPRIIEAQHPDEIVIALDRPSPRLMQEVLDHCARARLAFKIVPDLSALMEGSFRIDALRPVEIEDLLGRAPVDLTSQEKVFSGKRVLITGAGGSIGRELVRQTILQSPEALVLMGHGENSVFEALIELTPEAQRRNVLLVPVIGDISDTDLVAKIFADHRPHVVFHAAAHKHVHFMEAQPAEAVKNNIRGTWIVARAAADAGVERFIFVSTDKAVHPTSYMGASKRVAEQIVSAIGREASGVFCSVRFGNVLGSRGSVIPTFRRQIERGGPVTVTDPRATRYFMTVPEAVHLLIKAGAGGRRGELYVLDMGRPVKIDELARNLITLSGFEPEVDIPIVYTGLRPGEKLNEELLTEKEGVSATEDGKIFVGRADPVDWERVRPKVEALIQAAERVDEAAVDRLLRELTPEFGTDRDTQAKPVEAGAGKPAD